MNNFIAFDFETADGKIPCSIGIVEFLDGEVIKEYYSLINPNIDKFNPFTTRIHGISINDVINEREFDEIWKDIKVFFENKIIVAHNSSFDMSVLNHSLERYNIAKPNSICFCTLRLSKDILELQNYKLSTLASYYRIPQNNYHNALEDAFVCGKIFFHILLQVDDFDLFIKSKVYTIDSSERKVISNSISNSKSQIRYSKKKIQVEELLRNQTNKLEGQTFVVSGVFESISRDELKNMIEDNGGKVSSSISKKTSYVIAGNNMGPSKRSKAEQLEIPIISEYEFQEFLE